MSAEITQLPASKATAALMAVRVQRRVMRIGELAIRAHLKRQHADAITERSEAEGWDNDPTGSQHVSIAWEMSNKAASDLAEAIDEHHSHNDQAQRPGT